MLVNYNDEEGSGTVPLSFYYKIGNFLNFCRFSVVVSMIDSVNCIRNFVRVISAAKETKLHQSHILMKFSKNRYNNVGHFHNVVSLISVRQKHRVFERET